MQKAYHKRNFRSFNIKEERYVINEQIRGDKMRVINGNTNLGLITREEALRIAREEEKDLILIASPVGQDPVCKIMELSKYKYDKKQKAQKSRAKTRQQELKEFRVGVNTAENDILVRINRARKFLQRKDKVRFTLRFRGREVTHAELGHKRLEGIVKELSDISKIEKPIDRKGMQMDVTLTPKTKAEL
ncbi:translation initiation factor IF-3 [bacterium]|nr:translation initiation factor IF-3 [bacterium]